MPETQPDLREALEKINHIRNSIIGLQTMNWSEHVYPLVAALDAAGFEGMEYPEARKNFGTMLERTNAAEEALTEALAQVSALQAEVERLTQERDEAREVVALCNNSFGSYSYHTNPHPAEQIEKIKEQARSEWRRAEEALERLQKVEGGRGRLERDPCGSGSRPSDQAPAGLAPSGFDPSRGPIRADERMVMAAYDYWRHNNRPSYAAGPRAEVEWIGGVVNAALALQGPQVASAPRSSVLSEGQQAELVSLADYLRDEGHTIDAENIMAALAAAGDRP